MDPLDLERRLQPSRRHVIRSRVGRPDPRARRLGFTSASFMPARSSPAGSDPRTEAPAANAPEGSPTSDRRGEHGKVGLALLLWLLGVPGLLVLLYLILG